MHEKLKLSRLVFWAIPTKTAVRQPGSAILHITAIYSTLFVRVAGLIAYHREQNKGGTNLFLLLPLSMTLRFCAVHYCRAAIVTHIVE